MQSLSKQSRSQTRPEYLYVSCQHVPTLRITLPSWNFDDFGLSILLVCILAQTLPFVTYTMHDA